MASSSGSQKGNAASVAPLTRALRALTQADDGGEDHRWLWLGCRLAQELWDEELWLALATRGERIGRKTGRLSLLATSVNHLAAFHVHSGALATAAVLIDEVDAIAQATGLPPLKYAACKLIAARSDQVQMEAVLKLVQENAVVRGEGSAFWSVLVSCRAHAQRPEPV